MLLLSAGRCHEATKKEPLDTRYITILVISYPGLVIGKAWMIILNRLGSKYRGDALPHVLIIDVQSLH